MLAVSITTEYCLVIESFLELVRKRLTLSFQRFILPWNIVPSKPSSKDKENVEEVTLSPSLYSSH